MNRNLILRIITAVAGVGLIIPALVWSPYGIWFFCALLSTAGLWEYLGISGVSTKRYRIPSLIAGILIWLLVLFQLSSDLVGVGQIPDKLIWVGAILILPLVELFALFNSQEKHPMETVSSVAMAFIYCFLPFFLLYDLSIPKIAAEYDFWLPLGILILTWALDTMAYFSGRFFGKHPLFPRISPKKTWEGAIGGAIFCLAFGYGLQYFLQPDSYNWIIISGIICVFSQFGDLVESMYKRSVDLKDSGSLLPGHGGILDRFDGMYLSLPFLYLYFSLL
ncbi:phosphatidate cytidylyltransferase [Pontibacter sp. G13]|uniref:phosphatidate cytidylyltransferase n=1 Tax=Pontibacter sp. G13 TaxID=3074898 RepID=UPI00288BF743|nr:phosphatidate cytidylyltransferase [Pontibacter sp. G13]WNJ16056.1 phosphatidate cytidylyltransferase [Pontibacter sp. G13]